MINKWAELHSILYYDTEQMYSCYIKLWRLGLYMLTVILATHMGVWFDLRGQKIYEKGEQRSGRTFHVTNQDKYFASNSTAESGEQWATAACQKQ